MKRFANELDTFQLMIYEYLKKAVENEENLVTALMEIEEGFEIVDNGSVSEKGLIVGTLVSLSKSNPALASARNTQASDGCTLKG